MPRRRAICASDLTRPTLAAAACQAWPSRRRALPSSVSSPLSDDDAETTFQALPALVTPMVTMPPPDAASPSIVWRRVTAWVAPPASALSATSARPCGRAQAEERAIARQPCARGVGWRSSPGRSRPARRRAARARTGCRTGSTRPGRRGRARRCAAPRWARACPRARRGPEARSGCPGCPCRRRPTLPVPACPSGHRRARSLAASAYAIPSQGWMWPPVDPSRRSGIEPLRPLVVNGPRRPVSERRAGGFNSRAVSP